MEEHKDTADRLNSPDISEVLNESRQSLLQLKEDIKIKESLEDDINLLKLTTVPPIEGVKDMKETRESDLMEKVSWFFNKKIEENIKKWNWDEILCSWEEIKQIKINPNKIMRDNIKLQDIKWDQTRNEIFEKNPEILSNKKLESFKTDEEFIDKVKWYFEWKWSEEVMLRYKHKEIISRNTIKNAIDKGKDGEANLRAQLYRLFSENDKLYQEFLDRIWASKGFILWVENRWLRWWTESWGIHMWVDYNLPKWTPVNSIYGWKVVAIWIQEWIKKDPNVERSNETNEEFIKRQEQFNNLPNDKKWASSLWSMMLIKHEIWWKTFYSYYLHITPDKEIKIWDTVEKWQEVWKLAWYDTNGNRQPHLHFTIMTDVKAPMLGGYLNKNTITDKEKWVITEDNENEILQDLYNNNYGKYMINPNEIYN